MNKEIVEKFLNKNCKITINHAGNELYYTGFINSVDDNVFSFTDKFGAPFIFPLYSILELRLKQVEGKYDN